MTQEQHVYLAVLLGCIMFSWLIVATILGKAVTVLTKSFSIGLTCALLLYALGGVAYFMVTLLTMWIGR